MSKITESPETSPYRRAGIIGAVIGTSAVLLFLVLWFALEDVDTLARLVIAVCVPPGIMTLIVGGVIVRNQATKSRSEN